MSPNAFVSEPGCAGCAALLDELARLRESLQREPQKVARDLLRERGLCTRCGESPAAPRRRLCSACLAGTRADAAARVDRRRGQGRCQDCGADVERRADGRPHSRCATHRAAAAERMKRWRKAQAAR